MKTLIETKPVMIDNPTPRRISDGCGGYVLWGAGGGGSYSMDADLYNTATMGVECGFRMDGDQDER